MKRQRVVGKLLSESAVPSIAAMLIWDIFSRLLRKQQRFYIEKVMMPKRQKSIENSKL